MFSFTATVRRRISKSRVLDVPAVFAQVNGDAIRAAEFGERRSQNGIPVHGRGALGECGYVIRY